MTRVLGLAKNPRLYMPDPVLGPVLRPGRRARWRTEGDAAVAINAQGMRDDQNIGREKPPGTFRVAVLGDSYAEALQVDARDAFFRVMERRLRGCDALAGRPMQVLNFGVLGYGIARNC